MNKKGQILIIVNTLLGVLIIYSIALVNLAASARIAEKKTDYKIVSRNIAEAGIAKGLWCINQTVGDNCGGAFGSSYIGETDISFGGGIYDIEINNIDGNTKYVVSSGYYPNKTNTISKSIIRIRVSKSTEQASFVYGLQVGQGGIEMSNNSTINGSIYAHGNIDGSPGAVITGDAYVAGGTALTADQEHLTYNDDYVFGKTSPIIDLAQSFIPATSNVLNKISVYIKKTSNPANINVKIVEDNGGIPKTSALASATLNAGIVSTEYGWIDTAFTSPPYLNAGQTYWLVLDAGVHNSKYWTIGADSFDNYALGTMLYSSNWSGGSWVATGKDINFKIWLGGIETGVEDVTINGNAYAHNGDSITVAGDAQIYNLTNSTIGKDSWSDSITNSTIGQNATSTSVTNSTIGYNLWCETKSGTTVGWNSYCPTSITPPTDPGPTNPSISDAIINNWKTMAQNGGIIEGDYTIDGDTISLGPKKINGNLTIEGGSSVTITGTLYVTGNIIIQNNSQVSLTSAYGSYSDAIIADGEIRILNNVTFSGSGSPESYIMLISTKQSQTEDSVIIDNNATSAIIYAPNGSIDLSNGSNIKQATGYKIKLGNNASITYESGLDEVTFSSGPSGGWSQIIGSWQILE